VLLHAVEHDQLREDGLLSGLRVLVAQAVVGAAVDLSGPRRCL